MVRQKKFLVTVFVTIILTAGAATLAVRDLDSSTADGEKTERSSSKSSTKDTSWKKNIQSEGTVDEEVNESGSSSSTQASSKRSSASKGDSSVVQQSNTLNEDDFRSSDDLAYRMIAIYGMVHGDSSWKGLASASGITMTRQPGSAPVFIATDTKGGVSIRRITVMWWAQMILNHRNSHFPLVRMMLRNIEQRWMMCWITWMLTAVVRR